MNNLEKVVDAANAALREGTEHGSTSELYDALQKLLMVASGYLDNDRQNKPVLWGVRRDGVLLASYRDKDEAEDDAERYGGELCGLSYMTTVPSPELCGCGRPGDYMAGEGGLCCNKYGIRCKDKTAAVPEPLTMPQAGMFLTPSEHASELGYVMGWNACRAAMLATEKTANGGMRT